MYKTWEKIDLSFQSHFQGNPFTEVEFYATVTGVSFNKTIHGFYNGNSEFILRLSFDAQGEYTYTTHSNVEGLNGLSGELHIEPCDNPDKHGALILNDKNKKRLYYQDGTHYNLMAFECDWLFALSYDDKEKMSKTKSLINTISENRFNQVVMNVYAYNMQWEREEWIEDPRFKPEHIYHCRKDIYPFLGDNENPDFSALNVEFFKHLDNVIALLEEHNIIAHLMIYVWNKKVNWPEANSPEDNMYFNYVAKRYQAFTNILWDISKEALGYGHDDVNYIIERIARLREMDAYNRLITVHEYKFCDEYPELIDLISVQTWVTDLHSSMKEICKTHPNKVAVNVEHGGYEESPYQIFTGNYTDAKICLRRNYEIMFAGVYSSYYWQALSWSVMMLPEEAEVYPKFEYYKHMIDFFNTYDYGNLVSDDEFGYGGFSMVHENQSLALMFIYKENYAVSMFHKDKIKGDTVKYKFFNCITGEYSEEKVRKLNTYNKFISPFNEDSVLIVEVVFY